MQIAAFSVEPSRIPRGGLARVRRDAEGDDERLARDVDAVEEQRHEVELVQAAAQLRCELRARGGHEAPTDGTLAGRPTPRAGRRHLQTRRIAAGRDSEEELVHHAGCQRVRLSEREHRRQGRFLSLPAPHARTGQAQLAAAERQLPRRRAPVMMSACRIVPALRSGQDRGFLAKHRLERHQPSALHPGQQLVPRGRHPLDERGEQPRQGRRLGIRPLRFPGLLCSLGHRRLLGPRRGDCCLGRRDSHADLGAVATQFSNSTEAGTSPYKAPLPPFLRPGRMDQAADTPPWYLYRLSAGT